MGPHSPLEDARRWLRECGIERPEDDVKLLAAFAAGRPLRTALGDPPPDFTPDQERRFRRLVARRGEDREPAAYLVGSEEFMGLDFDVSPSVLIPRPSTETLVERAGPRPGRVLDVGTGSGAIAVALAVRGWTAVAVDLSPRALQIARGNAARHGVEKRIDFLQADLFPPGPPGGFDLVASNPPYVRSDEMDGLPPEVKKEPRLALDGGADGLDVVRRLVAGARAWAPRLLVEIAPAQAAAARDLALRAGFRDVTITRDLDGFDRVLEGS